MNGHIHIGTSGWHYDHWKGPFYPDKLQKKDFLKYYATRFQTVEINNSFYRLPRKETVKQWCDTVPGDFRFSVKASRHITHMKRLKEPGRSLSSFLQVIEQFEERLGIILLQLPPNMKCNFERLDAFLAELPKDYRYAFEFRDPDWFNQKTYDVLAGHDVAFCMYQIAGRLSPRKITANLIYIRLHGPGDAYRGKYDSRTLAGWARAFADWVEKGKEIYCYFDNDEAGYAAQDAMRLMKMIERR